MLKVIIALLILIGIFVILECRRELRTFRGVHYKVKSGRLGDMSQELKIVFLSDLHNYVYGEDNKKLIRAIERTHPDLILAGGDMLVGRAGTSPEPAMKFMEKLPAIAPVYYAYGNHEQRMEANREKYGDAFAVYKKELEQCGVRFLNNQSVPILHGGKKLYITGLTIPEEYYDKFRKKEFTDVHVQECLKCPDGKAYQILLAHHPGYFEAYKGWGADLTLSGHLHGGVVRIPGYRGVITPQAFLLPKYSGEMTVEDDSVIIVSKGLGVHTIPFRLFNPAEFVVVHLSGEK